MLLFIKLTIKMNILPILYPLKHLLNLVHCELNHNWSAVWAVVRIFCVWEVLEELSGFCVTQSVVGFNGSFAAHHNGCRFSKSGGGKGLVLQEEINHFFHR